MNNMYDILNKLHQLNESIEKVAEKIEPPIKTDPAERGKYKGKDIGDLKAMKKANLEKTEKYRERGEKVPDELKGKTAELNFAIRAKQAHGGKWGAIKEEDMEEGNDFTKARLDAIRAGKPTFKVDGKTYKVTGDTSDEKAQMNESQIEEGFADFFDKKQMYRKIGADVDGKEDDYTVTFKDGTRKRYQNVDGRRRITTLEPVDRNDAVDDEGEVVKRGRGRPKGTGRKMGARGKTRVSEQDLDEDSYPFPVKQTPAGPVVDNRLLAQKILTVASELGPKSQGMMSKMLRPGQTQAAEAVTELGEWLARAFNDQAGTEGAQLVDMMKYPTGPYAKYGDAYNSLLLALKKRGIDLQAAADGIKNWSALLKGASQQAMAEDYDKDEYDEEGEMAKSQSRTIADAAKELQDMLGDDENLPEWVQKKITLAQEYIDTARDYLAANRPEGEEEMDVEVTGDEEVIPERELTKPEMKKREEIVKSMKKNKGDFEKRYGDRGEAVMYATATKQAKKTAEAKGADKEEVEETTVAGSVATAPATGKAKGIFGKGVYEGAIVESFDNKLKAVLNEGMSINMSMGENGEKSLSVNATEDDAVKLAQILKLAGMESAPGYEEACPTCGHTPCGCEESLEEGDLANSPEEQTFDTETMINDLSGGLNGRKNTGQTTGAPFNADPGRQGALHAPELAEAKEQRLWALYQRYENK